MMWYASNCINVNFTEFYIGMQQALFFVLFMFFHVFSILIAWPCCQRDQNLCVNTDSVPAAGARTLLCRCCCHWASCLKRQWSTDPVWIQQRKSELLGKPNQQISTKQTNPLATNQNASPTSCKWNDSNCKLSSSHTICSLAMLISIRFNTVQCLALPDLLPLSL